MKRVIFGFIFLIALTACGPSDIKGIVVGVDDDMILLASHMSIEEYDKIKEEAMIDVRNADLAGESHFGLMELSYDHTEDLHAGDKVEVWVDGDIMDSYPSQAKTEKVRKLEMD